MAKATKITPKPARQPPVRIVLELSEGEADFILALTRFISGDPGNSPRKYSDRIAAALTEALGCDAKATDAYKLLSGNISFSDYGTTQVAGRVYYATARYRSFS